MPVVLSLSKDLFRVSETRLTAIYRLLRSFGSSLFLSSDEDDFDDEEGAGGGELRWLENELEDADDSDDERSWRGGAASGVDLLGAGSASRLLADDGAAIE